MIKILAVPTIAALALTVGLPAQAQTTAQTKVTHDTSVKDGVATNTTKVTHVTKRKTRRPKKILGVKVGHKTVVHKTTRVTKTSTDGDTTTQTRTQ